MVTIIGLLDPIVNEKIGSTEVMDILFATCGLLNSLQTEIVFASMDAGLSEASLDEIEDIVNPMIHDTNDMLRSGN